MNNSERLKSLEELREEIISVSKTKNLNFSSIKYIAGLYSENDRRIYLFRREGKIEYQISGRINVLPEKFKKSIKNWTGLWNETGYLQNIEQAFELMKSWVYDKKEVNDLPERIVRSQGIG